jgi:alpha-D-ribose 1-methylphosphonate 5-triphosphate synthase subunit PhnH
MTVALAPGFADPVLSPQSVFRALMEAAAQPASVVPLPGSIVPPAPLSRGAALVALTLFDQDTPIWLDADLAKAPDVAAWLRFHTGAPCIAEPCSAAFAIVSDCVNAPPFESFAIGTAEYPDRSTTLILQVEEFGSDAPFSFTGPGIRDQATLRATPLPTDFGRRMVANRMLFPQGIDLLLVTETAVVALPRSVTIADRG